MFNCLFVALGGSIGALSRYLVSNFVNNKAQVLFPLGTFTVNIIGCFIMGALFIFSQEKIVSPHLKLVIGVGFLGAFTTFSTFSLDTFTLLKENNVSLALLNVGVSVIVGLLAVWLGISMAKMVIN